MRKIKRLYFDFMSFWIALLQRQEKMVSTLEKGVKISHRVFYYSGYLRISPAVACLQIKSKKQQVLKKSQFLRKRNCRILEFCFYVKANTVLQIWTCHITCIFEDAIFKDSVAGLLVFSIIS